MMARPNSKVKKSKLNSQDSKAGFTLVEVMLVVGITGLMLVGLIGGTLTSINQQRYNDSIRGISEYIQRIYGEVQSPRSYGTGNSQYSVLGKLVVFGSADADDRNIYTTTVVGDAKIPTTLTGDVDRQLEAVNVRIVCGVAGDDISNSVDYYTPLWEAKTLKEDTDDEPFKSAILIVRAPSSGDTHTLYYKSGDDSPFDLKNQCNETNKEAAERFKQEVTVDHMSNFQYEEIGFCVKTIDNVFEREIRIAEDARNVSGVSILTDSESKCRLNR